MRLNEVQHAFITGGASGIGLALADALAKRDVAVTIADINSANLDEVLNQRASQTFRGVLLDVRDREAWANAKRESEGALGPVDLLILNAGIAPDGKDLADMAPEKFDLLVSVNILGVFNGISAFGADMRHRGRGHIVTTASMSGLVVQLRGQGCYSATKAAIISMTEGLRLEMAPYGVKVSSFVPGNTNTNIKANSAHVSGDEMDSVPRPKPGTAVESPEVAELVLRGIEEDRDYILTHSDRKSMVEERFARIIDSWAPPSTA